MNINKIKHSRFGRIVCRLFGEESGAVMMEYVIVAVMIAAAVMVGAWFFGKDILNMFGVGGRAATGQVMEARDLQDAAQAESKRGHEEATTQDKNFIKTDEANTSGATDNL